MSAKAPGEPDIFMLFCAISELFCVGVICLNGGNCEDTGSVFECMCARGYKGDRCETGRVYFKIDSIFIWSNRSVFGVVTNRHLLSKLAKHQF